jgi:hypothetical protein
MVWYTLSGYNLRRLGENCSILKNALAYHTKIRFDTFEPYKKFTVVII